MASNDEMPMPAGSDERTGPIRPAATVPQDLKSLRCVMQEELRKTKPDSGSPRTAAHGATREIPQSVVLTPQSLPGSGRAASPPGCPQTLQTKGCSISESRTSSGRRRRSSRSSVYGLSRRIMHPTHANIAHVGEADFLRGARAGMPYDSANRAGREAAILSLRGGCLRDREVIRLDSTA